MAFMLMFLTRPLRPALLTTDAEQSAFLLPPRLAGLVVTHVDLCLEVVVKMLYVDLVAK